MSSSSSSSSQTGKPNKTRAGRWSTAEVDLFEELIQKYGSNWKKIHRHVKWRSLSQIRSHAQKFFDKIGHSRASEYERKAKLIQAYETIEIEKRLQNQTLSKMQHLKQKTSLQIIKIQEELQVEKKELSKIDENFQKVYKQDKDISSIKEQFKLTPQKNMQALSNNKHGEPSTNFQQQNQSIIPSFIWFATPHGINNYGDQLHMLNEIFKYHSMNRFY